MIYGVAQYTNEAGFEQLLVVGCPDGSSDGNDLRIERANLDAGQQTTYDDFIGLAQGKAYMTVANTTCKLSYDRITSAAVSEDTEDLDYATMSTPDKAKLNAFIQLVKDLLAA